MASPTLQFKRGLFVNLPSLRAGEPGFTTDRSDLYVGSADGNKFYGSSRYWTRENGTNAAEFKFVDKGGNDGVSLRAPATVTTPVTYTLPEGGGSIGQYLQLSADGVLAWSSVTEGASLNGATLNGASFTGITTFSGAIDANGGLDVVGGASFDEIEVAGIATVGSLYVGSEKVISDELGALTLSNIDAIDATTKATLELALSLDPNDFDSLNVAGIGTISGLLDAKGGLDVTGHTELDNLNVSGIATFANTINGSINGNAGTATALQTGRVIQLTGDLEGQVVFDGTSNVSIAATIQANSVALGGDTTGDYVAGVTGTANEVTVSGSGGETASVVVGLPDEVVVGTSLTAPTVYSGAVKAQDGTAAITISNTTGNVAFASTVTIDGNLIVKGSTTTVNTETLLVKDSVIEIGLVDSNGSLVAPSSDANIDVGMVFHYYDSVADAARKAAVYWDDSEGRLAFASQVSESTGVLSATAYATILAGGLEINNACTGGTDTVISCVGEELALSNIVVDGGSF
jgi:hypothetical protein